MKMVIDISKEFEEHFKSDRFEDSLQRCRYDIKNARIRKETTLSGGYEIELLDMLTHAFENATPLPVAERYKPIILQEHNAEPKSLKAILDVKTNGIYILEITKGFAESMGMTIREVKADEDSN